MYKNAFVIITAMLLTSASVATFAHGGGGGSAPSGGMSGGMSSQHIGSEGLKNTNGPDAADQDRGLGHAGDRMNHEGLAHEKTKKMHTQNSKIKAP